MYEMDVDWVRSAILPEPFSCWPLAFGMIVLASSFELGELLCSQLLAPGSPTVLRPEVLATNGPTILQVVQPTLDRSLFLRRNGSGPIHFLSCFLDLQQVTQQPLIFELVDPIDQFVANGFSSTIQR